jgi:hypothetical protein
MRECADPAAAFSFEYTNTMRLALYPRSLHCPVTSITIIFDFKLIFFEDKSITKFEFVYLKIAMKAFEVREAIIGSQFF